MIIDGVRASAGSRTGTRRLSARVVWERAGREEEFFFDIDGDDSGNDPDPHPFVVGLAVPALVRNEGRIVVEGSICPRLRDGISVAAQLLRSWHPALPAPPRIEPTRGFSPPRPAEPPRAALFLSAGVDSSFSLLRNREEFSADHPASFRRVVFVRELVFPETARRARSEDLDGRSLASVSAIAAEAGLEIAVVGTNLAAALDDYDDHARYWGGGFLAAIGHLFAGTFTEVAIAATHRAERLPPWGTDPLLDAAYSTSALAIRHDGIDASRLEKVRMIARWPAALENLVVCGEGRIAGPWRNCGRCERCVRTRLALLACGSLERATTFPPMPLDRTAVDAVPSSDRTRYYWEELIEGVRDTGRDDLVIALEARARREAAGQAWFEDRGWKGALRRADRRWFGGRLLEWRRRMRFAAISVEKSVPAPEP